MAAWQFSVVFIPASRAEENGYNTSLLYDDEGYDTELTLKKQLLDIFDNNARATRSNIFKSFNPCGSNSPPLAVGP